MIQIRYLFIQLAFMLIGTHLSAQSTFFEYYEKGLSFEQKSDWNSAIEQFNKALAKAPKDENRKKIYGVQFIEYYPNREVGIAYYNIQNFNLAKKYIELSLQQVESKRAKEYLDKINSQISVSPNLEEKSTSIKNEPLSNQQEKKIALVNNKDLKPILSITDIEFSDKNSNNQIDGNEDCELSFTINNKGEGTARNIKILVEDKSSVSGLSFSSSTTFNLIAPNSSLSVKIPINGTLNLTTGTANIKVSFEEQSGSAPNPFELNIETRSTSNH